MDATSLVINGAAGRMGRRLVALASEDAELKVVAALERSAHPDLGKDAGFLAGTGPLGVPLTDTLSASADVLIDFSSPDSTRQRLAECLARHVGMVIGTTGLTEQVQEDIRHASSTIPILYSPNMSVGVNLLFQLVGQVARVLGKAYDIEIVEAHHRFKKDAPSGTARRLAELVAESLSLNLDQAACYGRQGITGERPAQQIGIHAIRGGDIVGEHTVSFIALGERVELRHVAQSRDTFVRGALRAAKFLAGKPPGLYTMEHALGLEV